MNKYLHPSQIARSLRLGAACAILLGASAAGQEQGGQGASAGRQSAFDRDLPMPTQTRGLDVEEHVGRGLPLELEFLNSRGERVTLGSYFNSNKPAVMAMVYYRCPIVCDVVMEKMAETFNQMDFTIGKDFNVLLFSFDHTETPADAASVKKGYLSGYSKEVTPEVEAGWEFHVSPDVYAPRQLSDALGFRYRSLPDGEFSHPVAIYVITPDGRISRYLYGYSYPPRDLKLSLIDATNGKMARSLGDRFMSFCYMYDPLAGSYSLAAFRVMQLSGILTVTAVGTLIGALFVGERLRRRWVGVPAGEQDSLGSSMNEVTK
ncbi:MAG: SCO family protein [Phycisphaeraceae bacterium]|nr:SCO family protein [Phycisphaeraceae bacterium]